MGAFSDAWLAATLALATPLIFAAMGELVSQRAGVLNVGLEGMMLCGAFGAFLAMWGTGSFLVGLFVGAASGVALAGVMALLTLVAKADQIVSGVGLGILAIGVTSFVFEEIFLSKPQVVMPVPDPVAIPGLSSIPGIGHAAFDQTLMVYASWLTVPAVWFVLYRTTWGLAIRSAGENPAASDTAGVSVGWTRCAGILAAGLGAGVGGAYLTIGQVGLFVEQISAGQGYIALAAVIFGGWRPFTVFGACLVFAGTNALQLQLQAKAGVPPSVWIALSVVALVVLALRVRRRRAFAARADLAVVAVAAIGVVLAIVHPDISLPAELWLAMPYVIALLALAGLVARVRMPQRLGIPYARGERA
jgi:simple sugar transport system permease protein